MEESEIKQQWTDFLDEYYRVTINEAVTKDQKSITVKFFDITESSPELAEELLEHPEVSITLAKEAANELVAEFHGRIRIINLPKTSAIPLWKIRTQIERFVKLEGYVSELGDVLIRPVEVKYECPSCGTDISIIRRDDFSPVAQPTKCSCGRKGKFRVLKTTTSNIRKIILEEDLMELTDRQTPKQKVVLLKDDLTSTEAEQKMHIGKKVIVNGWLKTFEVNRKTGDLDTYFIANSVEFLERGWPNVKTTAYEQEQFKKTAQDKDIIKKLVHSIMPTIHGEAEVKEALLLQLVASDNVYDSTGFLEERGCIHIALVGNPGGGKTYMIKRIGKFWPIYRFSSAQTATGRGLIAIAHQAKELDNKWVLTPGVIPTCSGGLCSIDELDKMKKEDYGYLNNAMNDLKVYVDKAAHGIVITDTAILASLNPVGRVFMTGVPVYNQINLPADLLDRFDLIFPVFAKAEEEDQRKVFRISIAKRRAGEEIKPTFDESFVFKYIAYARTFAPQISPEMELVMEDRVIAFMRPGSNADQPISNRVFGSIQRLVVAYARAHLREDVIVDDLNSAMDILVYSYQKQNLLTKEGLLDFGKIERVDMTTASVWQAVKDKIYELSKTKKLIPIEEITGPLEKDYELPKIEDVIEKLKTMGDIYEPKYGFVQRI